MEVGAVPRPEVRFYQPADQGDLRLPGSRASTYVGRAVLNSFLRHLTRSKSRLGSFARSFCCQSFDRAASHDTAFPGLFPVPLPYPEALCRNFEGSHEKRVEKRAVCAIILVLNYLHLRRPRFCMQELLIRRPLSKMQWDGIKRLEFLVRAWIDVSPVDADAMGRVAGKVESLEDSLRHLEEAATRLCQDGRGYFGKKRQDDCVGVKLRGAHAGTLPKTDEFSTFKEVDPSRLSFTGFPSFKPSKYLDELGRKVFEEPVSMRMKPEDCTRKQPNLKVHCSLKQKLSLFELLDSSGRLGVHRREEITPDFAAGLFAVVKDQHKDRLILDARGSNLLESPPQRWIQSLACGEALVKLLLGKHETLRVSGNDLRDFYYLFEVSEERSRRNVLVGPVHARKIAHLKAMQEKDFSDGMVYGSLRSLAMGDCWAVELAQTAHLSLALNSGLVSPEGLVSMHQPLPRTRTFSGLVIDDFISFCIQNSDEEVLPSAGASVADGLSEEYKRVRLIPNEKKAFRDEVNSSFWGVDLDGSRGLIRGSLKRAVPLVGLLLRVARLGYATASLLETLTGSVISLMLYRRRMLSLLDSLFSSYKGRNSRDVIKLDGRTISDLLIICTLLPICVTNLKADLAERVCATDSSNWGEAAAVAVLPMPIAVELYRLSLRRSLWVRLLAPSRAWLRGHGVLDPDEEVPAGVERYHSHPLWQTMAECLQYDLLFAKQKSGTRHINIGEVRGALMAEERFARVNPCSRYIYGLDSQVALGCLVKGRSSSGSINEELARSLPIVLMREMYSEFIYFETSLNPADDPTRGKDIRKPSRLVPDWWQPLLAGDLGPFDAWLRDHGVHPDDVGKLPPFSELLLGDELEETLRKEEDNLIISHRHVACFPPDEDEEHDFCSEPIPRNLADFGFTFGDKEGTTADTPPSGDVEVEGGFTTVGCRPEERRDRGSRAGPEGELSDAKRSGVPADVQRSGGWSSMRQKAALRSSTQLSTEALELLSGVPRGQFVGLDEGPDGNASQPGFLDLFSGVRGVAEQLRRISGRWVLCFDVDHSPAEDLDNSKVKNFVEELIEVHCFLGLGGGPVCGSFSMAVTPPVRDKLHPYGKEEVSLNMKEKILQGNRFARWMIKLIRLGLQHGMAVWLENPASSWLFRLPVWRRLMREEPSLGVWTVDYCRFYMKWRKRTAVVSNTILRGHKTLCKGGHVHLLLRGRCKSEKKSWTAVAQAYPRGVALAIAAGVAVSSKLASWKGKFDPAQCARSGHSRIGEAKNPGPRGRLHSRVGELRDVGLVDPRTLAIQDKSWASFQRWAYELITPSAFRSAMAHPPLLAELIREYGYHQYAAGFSLFMFRHLVVFTQQQIPGAKQYLSICWETISRWEIAEPVEHRTPVPHALFLAVVGVSITWKWKRFAGVVILSFLGISRPGEPLQARRHDLVLPSDRLDPNSSVAYLRVGQAKARRRGRNVVQHLTVDHFYAVQFLEKVFRDLGPDDLLYGSSQSAFRRRWDAVLSALRVPKSLSVTPGGLRGGGCIHAFHSGLELPKLMWRMRLKHQGTLESYLQECVASTILPQVSVVARTRIAAASSIATRILQL